MLGGGAGHIADMISRYKSNMSWLKKKRYFNKATNKYENRTAEWNYDFPHATPKQLQKLQKKLTIQRRYETVKLSVILLISIISGFTLIYWIFFMN